jgi:lipoate-protein ligase A
MATMPRLPWCFVNTGANTGVFNMRFDEALARRLQQASTVVAPGGNADEHQDSLPRPTLRLFRWNPWAISVGYNQETGGLDRDACLREHIDVVRRPTGGRAILHAEELTYSVVMVTGRRSVLQVYNDISRALVRGLRLFGVDAALQRSQPNFAESYRQPTSIPCFTSSARYEIEWGGRKLVGSAQRRFSDGERDIVLQHGSILVGPAHRRLSEFLTVRDGPTLDVIRKDLRERTVDLSEILGGRVDVESLGDCVRAGFEREWAIEFENCREEELLKP